MADPTHVLAGHKAAISNPNTSDEAKQHSEAVVQEAEKTEQDHVKHVMAGHKAVLSNPNASVDAKLHSKEILETGLIDEENKDPAHVAAGLKGAIHNDNNSLSAKVEAVNKLDHLAAEQQ